MTHPRKPAQQFRVPLKQVLHMSDVTSLPVGWFNSTVLQGNQDHHDKALKEKGQAHNLVCSYHILPSLQAKEIDKHLPKFINFNSVSL